MGVPVDRFDAAMAGQVIAGSPTGQGPPETQSGLPFYCNDGVPVAPIASPGRAIHLIAKRVFDVTVAALALVFLLPLFAVIAAAIKLESKGPVFFRQPRQGRHGKLFATYKFRSMRVAEGDASGIAQTVFGDPRRTRVGALLRRTSIDELPQLFNVLLGEMSIVGPRPHVPGMRAGGLAYDELVPYYDRRLDMLPGITGWAQANGLRGSTIDAGRARARIDHDIAYIQNFSIWLDLRIIGLTVAREFIGGTGH